MGFSLEHFFEDLERLLDMASNGDITLEDVKAEVKGSKEYAKVCGLIAGDTNDQ